ncbi:MULTISPECIES: hypothetical protein [unclassified Bradyrhizobium]|uniref:hypothetical protein n=1 Tax=unclassified Bradyrhizobium TaxID=2631580 RepID=UPI0028F0D7E2|nr:MULTISPECIES: hypothetical protein [unclassified Bradyrhizobium]
MAKVPADIRSLARSHTDTAIQALATIAARGKSEPARVSAASVLLDRGWGKAPQPISGDPEGEAIKLIHRIERVIVPAKGEE